MARPQVAPGKGELKTYLSKGMTQAQIAAQWEEDSGHRVSRSAIAMAIERFGLKSAHQRPRYDSFIPWRVAARHNLHNDIKMLRLFARWKDGQSLGEKQKRHLESWLRDLNAVDAVIHYDADTLEGFHWVKRKPTDEEGVPIRMPKQK